MLIKVKIWLTVGATVLLIALSPVACLRADTDSDTGYNDNGWWVYIFHLYYDNGQLSADRDFKFKYDLIAEPFTPQVLETASPFRGVVVDFKNEAKATFQFNPELVKGKISVKGPYSADAAKVDFYNDENQLLLTLDVSGSSVCNDDGICNSDVGENYDNCPNDCPRPTPSPSPTVTPPPGFFGLGWSKLILIIAGAVLTAVVIWVIWAIIKKRKASAGQNQGLPPPQPLP